MQGRVPSVDPLPAVQLLRAASPVGTHLPSASPSSTPNERRFQGDGNKVFPSSPAAG
ncbi:hypothetical protein CORC01_02233 [Colletotrichum orchidophilum]|uniref:Uncharacterized protein n=1 Tax=Colletotrichum orchidophilum TaxID=1209926 RepID=A0A1G4BML0_9PEZI|nr:uncharacterized protein CORC01_02233 [Colletotrichum orchidophilum]OHF02538.1 hypothetical protein CORC01_02233 [Colletotrichum orchidophilum]